MSSSAVFSFERTRVMGIMNVTPDSFSGDGLMTHQDYISAALDQALQMVKDGADILDIGGESSRPGAAFISVEEEISRVVPVIAGLRKQGLTLPLAVDTIKADVARAALAAGATMVNDISALAHDEAMADVVARAGASIVLMHNRSRSDAVTYDDRLGSEYQSASYDDVLGDVVEDLKKSIAVAQSAGIPNGKIILDPGVGFGKTVAQNLALINHIDQLVALGYPVLLGVSRKGFIGRVLNTTIEDRLEGTAACIVAGIMRGARIMRVHDVKFMARVVAMADAIRGANNVK